MISATLAAGAIACATARLAPLPIADGTLTVVGDLVMPPSNVARKPRAEVGGLSGAYFDRNVNRLYAVVDDRLRPRVIAFDVALTPGLTLTRRDAIDLQPPEPQRTLDAEGLAPAPNGHWFVASEGDRRGQTRPVAGVHEYTREGRFVRSLPLPSAHVGRDDGEPAGMRLNLSLEALSTSPDGRWAFAALESSLLHDGPAADVDREYAYVTDTMPRPDGWTPTEALLRKRLVLDLSSVAPRLNERLRRLENFEAIALGPRLADGAATILLISDDNFSPSRVTGVVALKCARGPR